MTTDDRHVDENEDSDGQVHRETEVSCCLLAEVPGLENRVVVEHNHEDALVEHFDVALLFVFEGLDPEQVDHHHLSRQYSDQDLDGRIVLDKHSTEDEQEPPTEEHQIEVPRLGFVLADPFEQSRHVVLVDPACAEELFAFACFDLEFVLLRN